MFRFSCFFCAVFSEQRGHTVHSHVLDAPSKLDNAKLGGQRLPITLRLRSRSWDVFADDLRANHLRLAARFLGRSAPDARPKIVNRSSS